MKINFNGQGMAVQFDKVPRFLYFNENRYGCGALFLDGQRIKGLVDCEMQSHTREGKPSSAYQLKFRVEKINPEKHTIEVIESENKL